MLQLCPEVLFDIKTVSTNEKPEPRQNQQLPQPKCSAWKITPTLDNPIRMFPCYEGILVEMVPEGTHYLTSGRSFDLRLPIEGYWLPHQKRTVLFFKWKITSQDLHGFKVERTATTPRRLDLQKTVFPRENNNVLSIEMENQSNYALKAPKGVIIAALVPLFAPKLSKPSPERNALCFRTYDHS